MDQFEKHCFERERENVCVCAHIHTHTHTCVLSHTFGCIGYIQIIVYDIGYITALYDS